MKTDVEYLELQKSTFHQQHQTYELTESKMQQKNTNIQQTLQNIDNELSTNHAMEATTFLNNMEPSLSLSIDYRSDFLFVSMINSKSIATEFNYKTTK